MKKSKFTEEQIAYALRQVEGGTPPADVCRQLGVSEATFYIWKKKYAHLGVTELRKLRSLEDENARLKRVVADLTLDKHMLAEALRKRSEARAPSRIGRLVSGDLWREGATGLSPGAVQSDIVVPPLDARGPDAIAVADSRARAHPAPIRLRADLGVAATRRLAGEQETRATTLSPRGPAAADARAPAQAHRAASRASATASGADGALEIPCCQSSVGGVVGES